MTLPEGHLSRRAALGVGLAVPATVALDAPSGARTLEAPLDATLRRASPLTGERFSVVGVTWPLGLPGPAVEVSVRRDGAWGPWLRLPPLTHGDDREGARDGTEPLWVGDADGIRTRTAGSAAPARLALIDPGPTAPSLLRAEGGASAPGLRTRRDWGADESWRNGRPRYNRTLKQVHVHHTASGNGYGRGEVPALIRGFYRYHTHSLGWSDIGYNFLVDRFGRAWVGRAGGAARRVRGAHTLGFNAQSTGVAIIGNHQSRRPSSEALRAVARLAAWKLDAEGIDPQQQVWVRSEGSDRYRDGRRVRLPAIDGHRDTNETACPGGEVYRRLPGIRRRAAAIVERAQSG